MNFPPVAEQLALIRRGVEKIVPEEELAQKVEASRASGKPLRIKYGIDPTGIDLHLGHTVPMRKMRQFQELGHQAVIIIGNYTAMVGDPSGRDETRARLSEAAVEQNAKTYLEQVGGVIDLDHAEVHRNGDWFGKMNFSEILTMCSKVTIAQLLTRDDFSKRMKDESPIYLHECLYPLMQAWDSVEIKADVELGGTEQLYSFMLARDLQKDAGLNQQIGIMSPILVGLDGVRRMGKSLGNYIGIAEAPYAMMKKFMQLSDDVMPMFFELLTDTPLEEVQSILAGHPKEAKLTLGKTVISQYHDLAEAEAAAARWEKEIGQGALPEHIPAMVIPHAELEDGKLMAVKLLTLLGMCQSSGEARRMIAQGAVYLGEEKTRIDSHEEMISVENDLLVRVGKKKICRVKLG